MLSKAQASSVTRVRSLEWIATGVLWAILVPSFVLKFAGAQKSIDIFSQLGVEPWGRYVAGAGELLAVALLAVPAARSIGAVVAAGVLSGAIASHLVVLGVEVEGDHGAFFASACLGFACSSWLIWSHRGEYRTFLGPR